MSCPLYCKENSKKRFLWRSILNLSLLVLLSYVSLPLHQANSCQTSVDKLNFVKCGHNHCYILVIFVFLHLYYRVNAVFNHWACTQCTGRNTHISKNKNNTHVTTVEVSSHCASAVLFETASMFYQINKWNEANFFSPYCIRWIASL